MAADLQWRYYAMIKTGPPENVPNYMKTWKIRGEIIGHFSIMRVSTRRNKGVFEAESRLWWVPSAYLLGRGSNG